MKKYFLRSFLTLAAAVLLSMVAVSHIAFMSVVRQIEGQPNSTMRLFSRLVSERLDGMSKSDVRTFLHDLTPELGKGTRLLEMDDVAITPEMRADMIEGGTAVRRTRVGMKYGLSLYIPVVVEGRKMVVAAGPVDRPYSPDLQAYLYMGGLVLIIVLVTSMVVSLPMWRRLRILEKTARSISDGHLDARIPIPTDDGMVGTVALQFNTMVERIEKLLASQKMMLQAVSHELRTPSARIRFGLEMIENASDQAERERRLNAIDEDLTDLDDLVEELLIFNKTEALGRDIETSPVQAHPVLRKMIEKRSFLRPGVEIGFRCDDPDISVLVDSRSFVRAIGNLVSNALRFSRSRVLIEIVRDGDMVRVAVYDDGPGVPMDARETILEPFKRLDSSRNRESGGAGLGLAIVSSIVNAHGGRVEVGDSDMGGAAFSTWWPAA